MKWTEEQLKEWDKPYAGRMNPRATIHCETCDKYYGEIDPFKSGKDEVSTTLLVDDSSGRITDCVHYRAIEIPERVFDEHMKILKDAGLYDPEEETEDF